MEIPRESGNLLEVLGETPGNPEVYSGNCLGSVCGLCALLYERVMRVRICVGVIFGNLFFLLIEVSIFAITNKIK